jgi:hypothetical protein
LQFNYQTKEINLIRRGQDFFIKNYILSPDFNLQELSLNYKGEDFFPIFYVLGGKDDLDLNVTIVPFITYSQYRSIKAQNLPDFDFNLQDYDPVEQGYYNPVQ